MIMQEVGIRMKTMIMQEVGYLTSFSTFVSDVEITISFQY